MKRKNEWECKDRCLALGVSCPVRDCKYWIKFEEDLNCVLAAIDLAGKSMKLKDVSKRLKTSDRQVKKEIKSAFKKIRKAENERIRNGDCGIFCECSGCAKDNRTPG